MTLNLIQYYRGPKEGKRGRKMNRRRPLRIAPSHYHVGHIVPATVAREMSLFEEEGLDEHEIVGGGIIPGLAEKVALAAKRRSL